MPNRVPKPQASRAKKTPRRKRPSLLTRRMASLAIRPKLSPRRNFPSRRNARGAINVNSISTLNGTERVATITIPVNSVAGQLLYSLENNPNSAPRASAVASQFDSWHSVTELEVETTGNAFAKNFIVIRHVPNGDPSRIPTEPQSLLNFAEAYSRRGESYKLQLDSNNKGIVRAPWQGVSYNPRKPINDSDPSERNNGLFIIVSNGSPGTDPVDITIRYRYSFKFYGPIYTPVVPALIDHIRGVTPSPTSLFGLSPVVTGPGSATATGNTITFQEPGDRLIYLNLAGTVTFTSPILVSVSAGNLVTNLATVFNAAQSTLLAKVRTTIPNAVVTFTPPGGAVTITGSQAWCTPYDYSLP